MLSHFLLPKEHTVHLSTARLPLPPLRHLGPSPRRCWCPRFCRRRNRRTRVWFRSERLRQAAARCVHSRALSPSALPAARGGLQFGNFSNVHSRTFSSELPPPPHTHTLPASHTSGVGAVCDFRLVSWPGIVAIRHFGEAEGPNTA